MKMRMTKAMAMAMQGNDADADGSRLLLLCYKILLFVAVVNCNRKGKIKPQRNAAFKYYKLYAGKSL